MKKILALIVVLAVLQVAAAEIVEYNGTNATDNATNVTVPEDNTTANVTNETPADIAWEFPNLTIPEVNMTEAGELLDNATQTGIEPLDQISSFLIDASPFLILIIGVIFIIFSGFAKMIGIILVILALIRLAMFLF